MAALAPPEKTGARDKKIEIIILFLPIIHRTTASLSNTTCYGIILLKKYSVIYVHPN
jgi:hypothetical protein